MHNAMCRPGCNTWSTGVVLAADASSSRSSASCTMGSSFMQTACILWGCSACSRLLPCVLVVVTACNHDQQVMGCNTRTGNPPAT